MFCVVVLGVYVYEFLSAIRSNTIYGAFNTQLMFDELLVNAFTV